MRDRMERFVVLPFSVGCVSHSSIDVAENQSKKTKEEPNRSPAREGENLSGENGKNAIRFIPSPRANTSSGLQRLIKGFKSFSQIFVYKEEEGMEMEIGSPTNVQHVAHVGWDDSTSTSTTATSWDGLISPDFLSFRSLSLKQFELAMASRPVSLQ